MDEGSQKPEQNQELHRSLCSSEQGTNRGTVGTGGVAGEGIWELSTHPGRVTVFLPVGVENIP